MTEYGLELQGTKGTQPLRLKQGEVRAALVSGSEACARMTGALKTAASPHGVFVVPPLGCLAADMTVLDQLRLISGVPWPRKKAEAKAEAVAEQYGLSVSLRHRVGDLPLAERFRAEMLRALLWNADAIVVEAPEKWLTPADLETMRRVWEKMAGEGKAVALLTISPDWAERAGSWVDLRDAPEAAFLPQMRDIAPGSVTLEVRNLQVKSGRPGGAALRGISLEARAGEITAVLGLRDSGLNALAGALAGWETGCRGLIRLNGKNIASLSAAERRRAGLSCAPGPALNYGMPYTGTAASGMGLRPRQAKAFQESGLISRSAVRRYAEETARRMGAAPRSGLSVPTRTLTAGEKQRCCLARELDGNPEVLVALRPTEGLAPGEARDVWERLIAFRDSRRAVLVLTQDIGEALAYAGRVLVLCRGEITGEVHPLSQSFLSVEKEASLLMNGMLRQDGEEPFHEE